MKPGAWPEIPRMQKTIQEAGYTPIPEAVDLVVTGQVVRRDGGLAIQLDKMPSPVALRVVAAKEDPETAAHLERHLGDRVALEGRWQPPAAGPTEAGALAVTAIHGAEDPRPRRRAR